MINSNLKQYFNQTLPDVEISEKVLEDIKVRTCFITTLERSVKLGTKDAPAPPSAVKYPGITSILVPGEIRENAFEVLWERDNDNLSLSTMVLDSIIKVKMFIQLQQL